jgi:hypothetical protein
VIWPSSCSNATSGSICAGECVGAGLCEANDFIRTTGCRASLWEGHGCMPQQRATTDGPPVDHITACSTVQEGGTPHLWGDACLPLEIKQTAHQSAMQLVPAGACAVNYTGNATSTCGNNGSWGTIEGSCVSIAGEAPCGLHVASMCNCNNYHMPDACFITLRRVKLIAA